MRQIKDFTIAEIIIALAAIVIVGAAVWNVWWTSLHRGTTDTTPSQHQNQASAGAKGNSIDSWLTYKDSVGKFSMRYPSDWSITTRKEGEGANQQVFTKLISPHKTVLTVNTIDSGGRGGACIQGASDKPFQAGNECPSFEYTSAEALPIGNLYQVRHKDNGERETIKATAYIATTHFAKADASGMEYAIGFSISSEPPPLHQPIMGAILFTHPIASRVDKQGQNLPAIELYASSDSPTLFDNAEGATVKKIIRTITLD